MTAPTALPVLDGAVPIAEHPRRAFVEQVMGLPVSLHVRGPRARDRAVAAAAAGVFAALRADDAMFSTWRPGSPVSRVRRGELDLAAAPARVREAAALCEEAGRRTGGAFSAWTRGFDPTGLVKGWAVQQAFSTFLARLAGLGPHDALVSAGGDVAVSCARADTPDWRVAVEDPRDRRRSIMTVPLRTGAVATSGTAARGAHIVDPATGTAPRGLLSATAVGPDLTWADVHATAAFVRGPAATPPAGHALVLVTAGGDVLVRPPSVA